MEETTKIKIIEVEGVKLTPGAKYIFTVSPRTSLEMTDVYWRELCRLIGNDNFTLWRLSPDDMKVYEVVNDPNN